MIRHEKCLKQIFADPVCWSLLLSWVAGATRSNLTSPRNCQTCEYKRINKLQITNIFFLLILMPLVVTPGVRHVGSYHRPSDGHFCSIPGYPVTDSTHSTTFTYSCHSFCKHFCNRDTALRKLNSDEKG